MYPESVHRATPSDRPQYFIHLKNGTLRPIKVPLGEAPLAIWYRGCWRAVFSRMETDEEYFAAHPDVPFRLRLHRSPFFRPDYFTFTIVTRDPEVYAEGDKWDGLDELHRYPGTSRDKAGRGPRHFRVGNVCRFAISDLNQYLAAHTIEGAQ